MDTTNDKHQTQAQTQAYRRNEPSQTDGGHGRRTANDHRIGQAGNVVIGDNLGLITQNIYGHKADLVTILNPILDASHTRNLSQSPPNSSCFPGTRKKVLKKIRRWADSSLILNHPHIMWVYGYAGCGKSAIALAICKHYASEARLAASFFFFRGAGDRSNVTRFVTTIASQVAAAIPATAPLIEAAITANPGLLSSTTTSLGDQFEQLVYQPIDSVKWDNLAATLLRGPYLIALDGLDECGDRDAVAAFIECMILFFERKPFTPLRFLITSRVESHIHQCLHSSKQVRLLDLVDHTSDSDIEAALDAAFDREKRTRVLACAKDWPSKEDKARLVKQIGGSYIFMTTLVRLLFDPNLNDGLTPIDRLPNVLSRNPDFDSLYRAILCPWQHLPRFRDVISIIALAMEPLSISQIAELLGMGTVNVVNALVNLHAILQIPGDDNAPVTLWHTSLRDFLCAEDRSGTLFASPAHHLRLAYLELNTDLQIGPSSSQYVQRFAFDHLAKFLTTVESQELAEEIIGQLNGPIFKNGQTALEASCHAKKWTAVRGLAMAGADLNDLFKGEYPRGSIVCALLAACICEEWDLVYLLLEKGAEPNIVGPNSDNPYDYGPALTLVGLKGNVKLATRLLECGADPNFQDGWQFGALTGACYANKLEIVHLLLTHDADPNLRDCNGVVPLHGCAVHGAVSCARALLMHKADPNVQNRFGDTPLHWACSLGEPEVVECLLEFKANTSIRNKNGRTPFQEARRPVLGIEGAKPSAVLKVLRQYGIVK